MYLLTFCSKICKLYFPIFWQLILNIYLSENHLKFLISIWILIITSWGWAVPRSGEARASYACFTWYETLVIYLKRHWGCLPFVKKLMSSSIYLKIKVVFHFANKLSRLPFCQIIEVICHFSQKLRSSSIFKKIEVIFHFQKKLRLSSI